ncbi:hypothetical protein EZI54_07290 [Marinobacter halodurans]|uniref:Type IV secretion system protein VirB3 n=1 Tax=Marinobacter halodurans TaxID=2528979 RepID=A0ABY1ZRK7_9GAMM|nr:hypothetical protein EZI54_07290 [Marinobacter halodurans]
MHLSLVTGSQGEPIVWAHRSQPATVLGVLSVFGVAPFLFWLMFPYGSVFFILMANLILDVIKIRMRVVRWTDLLRRIRFFVNAGYWKITSRNRLRQARRSVATFPGDPIL